MTLVVVEVARVIPDSANSLTIPLTFFDIPWLVFHPVKRVFFYRLTESTREHFHSFILPKLKLSLSLVLRNYLPLSGRITWEPNKPKPSIVVSQDDAVSVTIAETDSDFSRLSGYGQRPVSELHTLLPELPVSDDSATAFSLQITLFPDQGFSIGVAAHHAVLDGKTSSMFIKAWAHSCKHENSVSLPEVITPSLDRSMIKDITGLDEKMIKIVRSLKEETTNERSLRPIPAGELGDDVVLATVVLCRDDVERLRERVKRNPDRPLHLSTFVIACLRVDLLCEGAWRKRFAEERRIVNAVEILSGLVKGLSSRKIETIAKEFADGFDSQGESSQFWSVAGSNRLGVYESDFGWGRPVKVDVVSIDQGAMSMAESRDESGGVEIGMCLKKAEMDIVLSIFNNGLQC
ncbi:unnamed protein product [Microthlaspi erraticum]|uniref:Uncharacterized protein n=1 Tax=Microthlaspi erraticum TaxID=1685480 RepID=A0A6D2HJ50_9BRAS|nr:unnamed protein product [Microthlaspi erraticum]